ncbi:putative MFS family arabinose efflux permease [Collimonas sp. PA-H2]|uniref:MFS transporter n=1 Tax=Collimonas sp. PA-H2 TaxID=1881062 RepID=UPI000BF2B46F|nr:MFS transporter [Collimonas sp. PA-H2]PFH10600.1 putative MFS family arabinose efflux permease [Collimonas sp. PA-H2]
MSEEVRLDRASLPLSESAVTFHIVSTAFFTFICYLAIGIPLAVLPGYVHIDLGYSSVLAGLAISMQYLATLLSRPLAGRMADSVGPKTAVLRGLIGCSISGVFLLIAAFFTHMPALSLAILLSGRLVLGCGESMVGTGAITWGIGRVGAQHTARMISWNGIATYGALAIGAPLGVVIAHAWGLAAVGVTVTVLSVAGFLLARMKAATAVVRGEHLPFGRVLRKVFPHGMGLALGSIGFGSIATFITLFYASHQWPNAAFALTLFGTFFVGARLLFAHTISRFGGFRVSIVCFSIEAFGLLLLWQAGSPFFALCGAALTGLGFALIFPALGVEAVNLVPANNRGSALGAYSVFLDLALGVTGPLAGLIVSEFGYAEVYLFAAAASLAAVALTVSMYRRSQAAAS